MNASIIEMFSELDQHSEKIPISTLENWLQQAAISLDDIKPAIHFHPERYLRNLLHSGPTYQALVLCWQSGQRTPIHDHRNSNCAVKIFKGTAIETIYEKAPNGMVYPTHSHELSEGAICASQDSDMHQIANLQSNDSDLITMHIYSPPLMRMNVFSLEHTAVHEYYDPVNDEFAFGGGI